MLILVVVFMAAREVSHKSNALGGKRGTSSLGGGGGSSGGTGSSAGGSLADLGVAGKSGVDELGALLSDDALDVEGGVPARPTSKQQREQQRHTDRETQSL